MLNENLYKWFLEGRQACACHMLVLNDLEIHSIYPEYYPADVTISDVIRSYNVEEDFRLVEVVGYFNLRKSFDSQIEDWRYSSAQT